jgi:hypothetical protein
MTRLIYCATWPLRTANKAQNWSSKRSEIVALSSQSVHSYSAHPHNIHLRPTQTSYPSRASNLIVQPPVRQAYKNFPKTYRNKINLWQSLGTKNNQPINLLCWNRPQSGKRTRRLRRALDSLIRRDKTTSK